MKVSARTAQTGAGTSTHSAESTGENRNQAREQAHTVQKVLERTGNRCGKKDIESARKGARRREVLSPPGVEPGING